MIMLDTNYLIRVLVPGTAEAENIARWINAGEDLVVSTVAWYEFLCGPVDTESIELVTDIVQGRILPFTGDQSREAARLFNATGRNRNLRVDSMIAASAIIANGQLATDNQADFKRFVPFGLTLVNS